MEELIDLMNRPITTAEGRQLIVTIRDGWSVLTLAEMRQICAIILQAAERTIREVGESL